MTTMTDADIERMRLAALASGTSITRITGDGKVEHIDPADFYVAAPTDAELLTMPRNQIDAGGFRRLIALARIGAKVVAADEARTTYVKFDKKALDRLQRDLAALASMT